MPDIVNIMALSKLFDITTDYLLLNKEELAQQAASSAPGFLSKAEQLLYEKGYVIGYHLMWKELRAVIGGIVFTFVYLEAISILGVPFQEIPFQAFILPKIAVGLVLVCLIRLILLLILTIKFKNLDRK